MYTLEILYRSLAIAGAIGSLLGGVASVVIIWERSLYSSNASEGSNEARSHTMKNTYTIAKILIGSVLMIMSVFLFSYIAHSSQEYREFI
jgi:hypothetical protein